MVVYYSSDWLYQNYFSVPLLLDNCILAVYTMKDAFRPVNYLFYQYLCFHFLFFFIWIFKSWALLLWDEPIIQIPLLKGPRAFSGSGSCRLDVLDQGCARCIQRTSACLNCWLLVYNEQIQKLREVFRTRTSTVIWHCCTTEGGARRWPQRMLSGSGYESAWWDSVGELELGIDPWQAGRSTEISKQTSLLLWISWKVLS